MRSSFLFIYIIYSYSFVESVGRTIARKNGKNFDNVFNSSLYSFEKTYSETHAVPYVSHISMKGTYLKYKILILTWMVSSYLSINNFGFDYRQLT